MQTILDSIVEIHKKSTNELIPITERRLQFENSKYSATNQEIWHIYLNGDKLRKASDLVVTYCCIGCGQRNSVCPTQFLRKIRGCKSNCFKCTLDIHNSKPNHNLKREDVEDTANSIQTFIQRRQMSIESFESYPKDYQTAYFLKHLTNDDFNRIRKNIVSLCDGKYDNLANIEYWSVYKTNNQMVFTTMMYDKECDTIFKANQPVIRCDNCNDTWRAKSLDICKNQYKIMCSKCKLCNKVFKIRPTTNIKGETIVFQSKLEKKFVDWCNENSIVLHNGPNIEYTRANKVHKYRVDFQIGNVLIEIKDFHIWHKKQVESGLWGIKMEATNEYCKINNKVYYLITPENWSDKIGELLVINKI